jgi:regulator of replication initiation timing
VQPLETVLTPEVVGKLEPEDTTFAQQFQEIVRENTQLVQEMTTIRERSKENVSPDFRAV